jgi:hypothetical protein
VAQDLRRDSVLAFVIAGAENEKEAERVTEEFGA